MSSATLNLGVNLGGLVLRNPITTCSGTYGFGEEYAPYIDPAELGAISLKGLTREPRPGNPMPRIAETPAGMLNAIGLQNPGLEEFVAGYLPKIRKLDTKVIANIAGNTLEDYAYVAGELDRAGGVHAFEVNISCPNVKQGGIQFGTNPMMAAQVTKAVRENTKLPVIVKLSPNVTDITEIARAVVDAGADAVSLINTLLGMAIDLKTRRPVLANKMGGLSGPAVKPVAVRMVYQVSQAVKVPVLGMGGILTTEDALEFILAGATAVAIGTGNFVNPVAPREILQGIVEYCATNGVNDVNDLTGAAWK
ncbi:MAG TPA: dihydroorotate dehydrogenase [Verrucomicrobiae bacterium]|nr:dihydroorotate dehydrogenase [Verrucomicrobiae bacterium]